MTTLLRACDLGSLRACFPRSSRLCRLTRRMTVRLRQALVLSQVAFSILAEESATVPITVVPPLESNARSGKVVVWSAAMPSMWRKLCDEVGSKGIDLTPASSLANQLNQWQHDPALILPKDSSLTLAGNGTKAELEAAQAKLSEKFGETWAELDEMLKAPSSDNWFALSMLRQSLRFEPKFIPEPYWAMVFKNSLGNEQPVKCFGTPADRADEFTKAVRVLRYKAPNTILSIIPAERGERLFLSTMRPRPNGGGFVTSFLETVNDVRESQKELDAKLADGDSEAGHFGKGDLLEIPELHFTGEAHHEGDLSGSFVVPGKANPQHFSTVWHRVLFDMDAEGVKLEAKGFGMGFGGAAPKPARTRDFVFDQPFFIMAWRDNAPVPYMVVFVDNAGVMVRSDGYSDLPVSFWGTEPMMCRKRCSTYARLEMLKSIGGKPEFEMFVNRGLEYLKFQQNPEGSWSERDQVETTALALRSYLGRCETPESPFYGDAVMKAVLWLVEQCKIIPPKDRPLREAAILGASLGEMYVFARLGSKSFPGMREAFTNCVDSVIAQQQPSGLWTGDGVEGMITNGLCLEVLQAAKQTGLKIANRTQAELSAKKHFVTDGVVSGSNNTLDSLRKAVAVSACVQPTRLAEPSKPDVAPITAAFREHTSKYQLAWDESTQLDEWLIVPSVTRRYLDLTKIFLDEPMQKVLDAQQEDGSVAKGPTLPQGDWTAHDATLRRTVVALLSVELPYRLVPRPSVEDSFFDK